MHVMVDLETMGTRPSAPIVAIGAVKFDADHIHDEFYINVDLGSATKEGLGEIEPETVMWWLGQAEDARKALQENPHRVMTALYLFRDWLKPHEIEGMWGNGASFDNVILAESYARVHLEPPWPFWLDRCYRTVKKLAPSIPITREGTHHNALDDAKSQALHLIRINNNLGGILS